MNIKLFLTDNDGTLTDGFTYYSEKGEELKRYNHRDGRGVFLLKQKGIKFGIITGENSEIVKNRAQKLNADYCYLGVEDKVKILNEILVKEKILPNEVAYIGDDTNDSEIIKAVGISFAPKDAHKDILEIVNVKCSSNGGFGAVRDAIDFLLINL
jgi:N-acylneuraminate cytidylyltransferase